MILHIPHSSLVYPAQFRSELLISPADFEKELTLLTDLYCDQLYAFTGATAVIFPYSRLFCDAERFENDDDEPMVQYGQGLFYTKTNSGHPLRLFSRKAAQAAHQAYQKHHRQLNAVTSFQLAQSGTALIVDCHSFSAKALHTSPQYLADVCIGTDPFHTPTALAKRLADTAGAAGYTVSFNTPFAGSLVPLAYYKKEPRVISVMIEINRRLYLETDSRRRSNGYEPTRQLCAKLLQVTADYNNADSAD